MQNKNWAFWIDRGGTFTDIIARNPQGKLQTLKVLSETPEGRDAAVFAINKILGENSCSIEDLSQVRMGTTIGTNALLTRRGARTLFVTTKGFADSVRIGYQNRPNIFALQIVLSQMLYEKAIEFDERIDINGVVLKEPDLHQLRIDLQCAFDAGIKSCAIALMHAYKYPQHEKLAATLAKEIGFTQVSVSHEVAPLIKLISRADTTLADAYLSPLLNDYIDGLRSKIPGAKLQFMQSNGGLADASLFKGKDSIISGPAGGLVGAIKAAASCGFEKLISFDMGGTSTDVAHFHKEIEHIYDCEISGMRIRAPMMDIHTVAAGGGSVLSFDGARYRVGPDSAGANPGPLSYGRKGPLTLTDANVMLGRIQPSFFPSIFGNDGKQPLDAKSVKEAFNALAMQIRTKIADERSPADVAYGFVKIAVAKMANAIKHVSIQRGHDLRNCVLVCFGGAGAQFACLIAEELGIQKILIHPLAGILSAYGIGLTSTCLVRDLDINKELRCLDLDSLRASIASIVSNLNSQMLSTGVKEETLQTRINALVFMEGSDYSISVPFDLAKTMADSFAEKHLKRYGFTDDKRALILGSLSIQVMGSECEEQNIEFEDTESSVATDLKNLEMYSKGKWHNCPLLQRNGIKVGDTVSGPAMICEKNTTTALDDGWQANMLANSSLILSPVRTLEAGMLPTVPRGGSAVKVDPINLELFNNLFKFVAEQMGLTLQNTSQSVNIKERLDFSCALFDADGNLVANAPHIPVHLGSMGESVQSLISAKQGQMRTGDAFAINDPYAGGTHLPDLTIISPAFDSNGKIIFYVASRGHHADIGGITPGSMPADSRTIEEEGILFRHMLVMRDEKVLSEEIESHLLSGKYPARKASQNIADLKAQIAANSQGIKQMNELINNWGEQTVSAYMGYVQDNAEHCVRQAISSLRSGSFASTMDDGSTIQVKIEINNLEKSALIDFSGSSAQTDRNFNAPLAVCKAAVLYVFRTLVSDEIPLNAGCFRPLELIVPASSLLNPDYPSAVVAGNVETSQVIVDVLYGALGIMAGSQGTMNNLSFGNDRYQYYETISGGTGAGATFAGAGPVQSNMTNSQLTDPEVLEANYPVLLEAFSVRQDSGGKGRYNGGNGAVRRIRFKEDMTVSILSNRRKIGPHGLAGGAPGLAGKNIVRSLDGNENEKEFRSSFSVNAGDCLIIETPGGGGFGQ